MDTGDGSVNIAGRLDALKVRTGDGSIVYRAEPGTSMTESWEIITGDGGVTLYLPPDFGAELDAHTGDGTIRNDLAVESANVEGDRDARERRTLRGRIGAGGKVLRVRTGDGAIRLKRTKRPAEECRDIFRTFAPADGSIRLRAAAVYRGGVEA